MAVREEKAMVSESSQEIQVDLVDGDRMISLAVNPNDSLYQEGTETEDDAGSSSDGSANEDSDEGEPEVHHALGREISGKCGTTEPVNRPIDRELSDANQQRKNEIDAQIMRKIQELQQEMTEQGMHNAANLLQDCLSPEQGRRVKNRSRGKSIDQNINPINDSNMNGNSNKNKQPGQMPSEVMIYDQAVEKRFSSSSEENLGFSDDSLNNELYHLTGDVRLASDRRSAEGTRSRHHDQLPSTSKVATENNLTPEQRADEVIRQAESAKAWIFPTSGESLDKFHSIVKIDQEYQLVGSHLDDALKEKIARGEYIDFGKLLPKDHILAEEDERLELIIKQGNTFWSPVSESVTINGYNRWEQAFHIYSDIYT